MCNPERLLVQLIRLIDLIPTPPPPVKRKRGRPFVYSDRLFLKVLLIMVLKRLHRPYELYSVLTVESADADQLRALLFEAGRFPARRTFERRLKRLPDTLPAQIACLGALLVQLYQPWAHSGRAAAIDSTILHARGAPWHMKDRKKGLVPNTSIDTEAHWTHSGWHNWVYGWKLHLVTTVASIWIPLAARLCPANEADNSLAPELIRDMPGEARYLLADVQYNAPNVREACDASDRILIASGRDPTYPRNDPGAPVRKVFHALRSATLERFNAIYKNVFEARLPVPTKGRINTARFALGAVFVYQLVLLYRYHQGIRHQRGVKTLIRLA
jgi:hypothetical protein